MAPKFPCWAGWLGQRGAAMGKDGRAGRAGNAVSAFLPGLHPGMILTAGQPFLWHLFPHTPDSVPYPSPLSLIHNHDHRTTSSPQPPPLVVSSWTLTPAFIQSLSQSHDLSEFWPYSIHPALPPGVGGVCGSEAALRERGWERALGLGPSGLQALHYDNEDKGPQEGFGIPGLLEERMNERLSQKRMGAPSPASFAIGTPASLKIPTQ